MKKAFIKAILSTAALAFSASLALAVEVTVTTPDVKGAAKSSVESTKAGAKAAVTDTKTKTKGVVTDTKSAAKATAADTTAKTKTAAASVKATRVDINSASEAELRAIPGMGDSYASKIIAGRPYTNKSQLKTRNILPAPVYDKVKDLIVAKKAVSKAVTIKK
jgi:DNA uptake protein ComE-like DNA-binding protein